MTVPVLFDHDGALEDFVALLLLLTYEDVDLKGITVTPVNCMAGPGTSVTRKILEFAGRSDVTTASGTIRRAKPVSLGVAHRLAQGRRTADPESEAGGSRRGARGSAG